MTSAFEKMNLFKVYTAVYRSGTDLQETLISQPDSFDPNNTWHYSDLERKGPRLSILMGGFVNRRRRAEWRAAGGFRELFRCLRFEDGTVLPLPGGLFQCGAQREDVVRGIRRVYPNYAEHGLDESVSASVFAPVKNVCDAFKDLAVDRLNKTCPPGMFTMDYWDIASGLWLNPDWINHYFAPETAVFFHRSLRLRRFEHPSYSAGFDEWLGFLESVEAELELEETRSYGPPDFDCRAVGAHWVLLHAEESLRNYYQPPCD